MAKDKRQTKTKGVNANEPVDDAVKDSKTPPTDSDKEYTYDAFRFAQREGDAPKLVLFHAKVHDILKWADVGTLSHKNIGAQRERKKARVTAITKFMKTDDRNIIPTAVIIGFPEGTTKFKPSRNELVVLGEGRAATIVDGQHRLYGLDQFDKKSQVPVVGILDADKIESAFQFLVINNKGSRVPPSHTKAVLARMSTKRLAERLASAHLALDVEGIRDIDLVNSEKDSPFYEAIAWTVTPEAKRLVQATAIELSLEYMKELGVPELDDRDVRRAVFLTIWRAIRAKWMGLWKKDSRLLSKVGVFCLTRFIMDLLTSWADNDELDIELTELGKIEEQTKKIIGYMDQKFWTAPWASGQGGFDTGQGRERVVNAITQLYRNGRRDVEWYTDIDIIEWPSNDDDSDDDDEVDGDE